MTRECNRLGGRVRLTAYLRRRRVDGKFLGPGGSSVPEGQALLSGILDACFEVAQDIKAREAEDDVSPTLKPIHDRLAEIKAQLERLRGWQVGSAKSQTDFA